MQSEMQHVQSTTVTIKQCNVSENVTAVLVCNVTTGFFIGNLTCHLDQNYIVCLY
jgi:predicted hydrocarbon binding protein